ncbi:MAG: reverse gyrase [Zestosphaera tikiterensis]|uniref:Reverse gyrase n=1 Tax=Zestosphaera tikiterensis TaxID=1973259 RepID=A0A2R7Y6D9_9CREN|nr:MAG: reverse gyrase [Zestosphaera tikiterensis]
MPLEDEVREAEYVVYGSACPNCGGFISDTRLRLGLPCSTCLPTPLKEASLENVVKELRARGFLKKLAYVDYIDKESRELSEFFKRCVGSEPWSIQRLWIKRVAKKASFAMIAPTGIGKTTFGLVTALYKAKKGEKSYILVPTTTLAMQLERKINEIMERVGFYADVLVIHSKLRKSEKLRREANLDGNFDILVTTSRYFMKNFDRIRKHNFSFIFVDDVDAVLKGSKAINYILELMGFTEEDLAKGLELVRLKRELAYKGESPELMSRINVLKKSLELRNREGKVLIVASATGNPRGTRVKLFRELMGFEIGARPEFIRNVEDTYVEVKDLKEAEHVLLNLLRTLGGGGLVYVPIDLGIEYANALAKFLNENGIKAQAIHSKNVKALDMFIRNEVEVLVGVATYYGVLVRGIDLPVHIRYAVFIEPPRHKINLRTERLEPQDILRLLPIVRDAVKDAQEKQDLENTFIKLRRVFRRAGAIFLQASKEVLSGSRKPQTNAEELILKAYHKLKDLLSREEIISSIKNLTEVSVVEDRGSLYVLIPDAPTYIQATGRTSRLFLGGISKGLSVVITSDVRLLKGLEKRLRLLIDEFTFTNFKEVDLNKVLKEIKETREAILKIYQGVVLEELVKGKVPELKTVLMVVESPNKARTIARLFGRPSSRDYGRLKVYEVNIGNYTLLITASGGHIYELLTELTSEKVENIYSVAYRRDSKDKVPFIPIYETIKRCLNCGHQFVVERSNAEVKCPVCGSVNVADSIDVINAVRDVALEVDEVWLGTDPDTEGEKIAYDLKHVLLPMNKHVKRIEFHEVTRRAILNAMKNPRDIDENLVKAQLIRRIEDRWIGFTLSEDLQTRFWRDVFCKYVSQKAVETESRKYLRYQKLCSDFKERYRNLSAGRVQTPVLGWIIERYDEYVKSKTLFVIVNIDDFRVELPIPNEVRAKVKNGRRLGLKEVKVNLEVRDLGVEQIPPLPPYSTDTALSEISSRLGMSTTKVMDILQDLFELGFITYHRTDSVRVSDVGISIAREYLSDLLKDDLHKYFTPRVWSGEGAHECIRPTRPLDAGLLRELIAEGVIEPVKKVRVEHFRVYDLIFRRFIASQMKPAEAFKKSVKVKVDLIFEDGEVYQLEPYEIQFYSDMLFDGFNKVYEVVRVKKAPEPGLYILTADKCLIREWFTKQLHTQATLVKTMKEKEIGRPSTYAKIIDTVIKRRYVMVSKGRNQGLVPLLLGIKVYEYLTTNYNGLVSEERTRLLERMIRDMEEGKAHYGLILNELFEEIRRYKLLRGGAFAEA